MTVQDGPRDRRRRTDADGPGEGTVGRWACRDHPRVAGSPATLTEDADEDISVEVPDDGGRSTSFGLNLELVGPDGVVVDRTGSTDETPPDSGFVVTFESVTGDPAPGECSIAASTVEYGSDESTGGSTAPTRPGVCHSHSRRPWHVNYPDRPRSGLPAPRLVRTGIPVSVSEFIPDVGTEIPDSAGDFPLSAVRSVPLLPVGHSTTTDGARFLSSFERLRLS